jgi:hypothetical protein
MEMSMVRFTGNQFVYPKANKKPHLKRRGYYKTPMRKIYGMYGY